MLSKDLVECGFTEKEARVYITLLKLEISGAKEIAKISELNRSTTYVTLESLKKQGLVSVSDDKNVRQFVATSPEILIRKSEQLARKYEAVRQNVEKIIPEMKALHKDTRQKPTVKVYEGKQGLVSALEDTLRAKEKLIRVSSSVGNLTKALPEYFPEYVKKRMKLGIKMHGIHPDENAVREIIKKSPAGFDQPVLIPKKTYDFLVDFVIYDDKIGYISSEKEGVAIIIESNKISRAMKSIFDLAWAEAKHLSSCK